MNTLILANAMLFLSTLSLRRATGFCDLEPIRNPISIHALLAESDHLPATEPPIMPRFLSTLSLRRATANSQAEQQEQHISIHALLAESDKNSMKMRMVRAYFYPRSPCGERQKQPSKLTKLTKFLSTLSLRRATNSANANLRRHRDFYPRSPCGERLMDTLILANAMLFLSTLSLRRATAKVHKTVGYFCAYEINFMEITSSC